MAANRRLRAVPASGAVAAEHLLRQVAHGDAAAFARLFDELSDLVYGVIRRVLRDPSLSEEVSQEVFVEVWRNAPRFEEERGSARTWVLTMAHRRAIDRVRSEQASRDRTDRVGRRNQERAFDAVAEQAELNDEHRRVNEALTTLTAVQREAVELAYYHGYTYREVAELLDTPLGTIKTRMRDGMIRLRDAMGVTR